VEAIALASAGGTANEVRLSKIIDPSAAFELGGGDVRVPLGKGVAGAVTMAMRMDADQYRLLGWDYMAGTANGCGKGEIEVEFFDSAQGGVSKVKFSFDNGRVVGAQGWQRSYQSGPLVAKPDGS
jgi:hypothetical protein